MYIFLSKYNLLKFSNIFEKYKFEYNTYVHEQIFAVCFNKDISHSAVHEIKYDISAIHSRMEF